MLEINIYACPDTDSADEPHYKSYHQFVIETNGGGTLHSYRYRVVNEDGDEIFADAINRADPSIAQKILKDCLKICQ